VPAGEKKTPSPALKGIKAEQGAKALKGIKAEQGAKVINKGLRSHCAWRTNSEPQPAKSKMHTQPVRTLLVDPNTNKPTSQGLAVDRKPARQTDDCSHQRLHMVLARTRRPASSHNSAGRSQPPTTQIHQVNNSNLCKSGPFAPPTSPNP